MRTLVLGLVLLVTAACPKERERSGSGAPDDTFGRRVWAKVLVLQAPGRLPPGEAPVQKIERTARGYVATCANGEKTQPVSRAAGNGDDDDTVRFLADALVHDCRLRRTRSGAVHVEGKRADASAREARLRAWATRQGVADAGTAPLAAVQRAVCARLDDNIRTAEGPRAGMVIEVNRRLQRDYCVPLAPSADD